MKLSGIYAQKEDENKWYLKMSVNFDKESIDFLAVDRKGKTIPDGALFSLENGEIIRNSGVSRELGLVLDEVGRIKMGGENK